MVNCDFCGKEILTKEGTKKETMLSSGNYCSECKNRDITELFEEILEEDSEEEIDEDI
ncbi:MAG: hypothetical protein WC402_03175 [Candidatus Pacearchaeota archaeon]|jgi:hypothetical protein